MDLTTINSSTISVSTVVGELQNNGSVFSTTQTEYEVSTDLSLSSPGNDDKSWQNVGWKSFNFATGEMEFEVPFLLTVALCGFLGNVLVLIVYLQKKYRKSSVALYIINLAVGDLFIVLIVVVFHITEFFPQTWPYLWGSDTQCWLHRFARFLGFNSTIFTSMCIAIDRFLAVVKPLQFKALCTTKRTLRNIVIVWIVALLTAIPCAWNFRAKFQDDGYYENYRGKSPFACFVLDLGKTFNDFKIVYMSILLFYVPVAITMIFYSLIVTFLWKHNKEMKEMTALGKARRSHWKTARMLMLVFIAYVACFVMFSTYTIVQQLFLYSVKPIVKNIGLLMPYANSCLNPIMYSLINQKFRSSVVEIFSRQKSDSVKQHGKNKTNEGANRPEKGDKVNHLNVDMELGNESVLMSNSGTRDSGVSSISGSPLRNTDKIPMDSSSVETATVSEQPKIIVHRNHEIPLV